MSLEFDCDQLFQYFKNTCENQLNLKSSYTSTIIQSQQFSGELSQHAAMESGLLFSQKQPQQNNHIWFDCQFQHLGQKNFMDRKQTLACQEQLNMCENFSENISKTGNINKNQTKNIPKNFGKAIMAFIQKHKEHTKIVLKKTKEGPYKDFLQSINERRKQINTIADLREMWVTHPYSKALRILSNQFLRKHALKYIFNSRINSYGCHIKYRQRLVQAIKKPKQFQHIKDY